MIEFEKLIKNKLTYVSLFCLMLIVAGSVWTSVSEYKETYSLYKNLYHQYPDALGMLSPHQFWLGMSDSFFSSFYYFIFPLLIAIPIVDTIFQEKVSGYANFILTRKSRFSYYVKKFVCAFLFGFMLFIIPLICGIILINGLTGQWDYSNFSFIYEKLLKGTAVFPDNVFEGQKRDLFSNAMIMSPYLYISIYYIVGAFYAGMYMCFGLALSLFIKNRYLLLFAPLMLYLGVWVLCSLLGVLYLDPYDFLDPRQSIQRLSYWPILIDFVLLFIITGILYLSGVKKNSDLLS
ncbi:NADH dehydrogenase FAD-containing subunit [Bacillus swezeyi]|uniref:NADH dehydrogenase FAD-containing subunit n=1 Tax=Bacillus swezeyi TaxID=1925020 RepID=UPI002E1F5987|nr:NADH dehydrogenase FAD-containing subunit [Bacillus swezeyi]MED2976493.1 NADH dehydrogenase FAD-containing subunit [Bacillus swezeyi]